eukprot:3749825-Pyramimonas_sp.AAC.1
MSQRLSDPPRCFGSPDRESTDIGGWTSRAAANPHGRVSTLRNAGVETGGALRHPTLRLRCPNSVALVDVRGVAQWRALTRGPASAWACFKGGPEGFQRGLGRL